MKKVYIPTEEELYKMQNLMDNGTRTYQYLVAKVIEVLTMESVLEPDKPILDIAYEQFSEFPEIVYTISKMYPEQISRSEIAINDVQLCQYLIKSISKQDDSIKQLDEILPQFESGTGVLSNNGVVKSIAKTLSTGIQSYPKYRFEYKPNDTLDKIFSCEIKEYEIPNSALDDFMSIEPAYSTKVDQSRMRGDLRSELVRNIVRYTSRYDVEEHRGIGYQRQGILPEPDKNVKKLIRCLQYHKNNYQ